METINASWRGFKCRIEEQHFYKYKDNEDRMKHRPVRVPEPDFKTLLAYWSNPQVKEACDKNAENHNLQDNNHTVGPVSFARIFHKLSIKDKEPPSKRKMFKETSKRKEGRTYKRYDDDSCTKIERMKQFEASQVAGDIESERDAFDEVMDEEHTGRLRLFGRGVSSKGFKGKETGTSIIVPSEAIESMKADMQKELENHKEAMQVQLQADKKSLAKERETQAEISKEPQAQISLVAKMKVDIENDKQKAARELASMALDYIRQNAPKTTPEMMTQAIASSIARITHQ